MLDFSFQNPTKILFGRGRIADIGQEIPKDARIMITYGGGSVKRNGVLDEVKQALNGYDVSEYGGIEPNPTYETLMPCVEIVQARKIDFLLAVGGGSVVDGTKFIAAAALYPEDPWNIMLSHGSGIRTALPFGVVLTLPATGSEMNNGAVISRKSLKAKLTFGSTAVYPRFSVLDPTKTYTLPAKQISNGVVDAFVHVMEQYLTYPVNGKVQDRFAEGLLLTLIEEGPKALQDPKDYDVRANIMWCATLALNGLISAGVPQDWATHMVGHEITALHGLDHGQTLAIVLPAMMQVCREDKRDKLLQYAERIWNIRTGTEEERIDTAIKKTREFFEKMQIKTHLSDYGIGDQSIPIVLEQLEKHGLDHLGEHQNVTPDVVRKVLELSL